MSGIKGKSGIYQHKKTQGMFGKHHSLKTKNKIGKSRGGIPPWNTGKQWSKENKEKMSIAHLGQKAWNRDKECPQVRGEKNGLWKGENAGYFPKHRWVYKWKGHPKSCIDCGKIGEKIGRNWNIDWSNCDHKYRRVLEDYSGRCKKCHGKYDKEHNLKYANKFSSNNLERNDRHIQ